MMEDMVLDATMGCRDGLYCFCPVELDDDGKITSVVFGLTYASPVLPENYRVIAVVHEGGNEMANMADTPSAANNLKKRLSQLFDFAILLGWQTNNPAKSVRPFKIKGDGIKAWGEAQIDQYMKHHPIGTKPHLALALLLYTAQRRSDVVVMGRQHIEGDGIRVKQLKTGKALLIPMHPKLWEAINACPSGHLAFLVSKNGAPFQRDYFGNWFRKQCDMAGLKGYSAHGLRKAASRRMAELGLSNQIIKSITGHSSDAEVARYTKSVSQEKMARIAMDSLAMPRIHPSQTIEQDHDK